ncbi:MAG TPA: tRNA1(Val) (adenine(37)-N6)-methyltransferase [Syntrophales bacterium]|nr:tRNA1(Val) (adenine(37)-N6)-methyltransferase [Syntrophales bacterium]
MKKAARASLLIRDGETVDHVLGGRLTIFQKKRGYRFSLDALLLAHFVKVKKGETVIDLGTGSGVIALIVALRKECREIAGVDIQKDLVDMAKRTVSLNNLDDRVAIRHGDIRRIETLFKRHTFDVAVFNPPYRRLRSGRINPDAEKSIARHEVKGALKDFLKAAAYVLASSGRVYVIYPATRMVELLSSMRAGGMEPKRLQIVHSKSGSRGEFALVEGVKNGREQLDVLPPLVLYSEKDQYTEAMNALFRELSGVKKSAAG